MIEVVDFIFKKKLPIICICGHLKEDHSDLSNMCLHKNKYPCFSSLRIRSYIYCKCNNFKKAQLIIGLIFITLGILGFYSVITDKALQDAATDAQTKLYERSQLIGSYDSPQNKYQKYFNFFNDNPYSNLNVLGINPFGVVCVM